AAGETVALGKDVELHAGDGEVDPLVDGFGLDVGERFDLAWQGGELGRDFEGGIFAPEPEQAHEPFPVCAALQLGGGELSAELGIERMLARLVELVESAGFAKALGDLGG